MSSSRSSEARGRGRPGAGAGAGSLSRAAVVCVLALAVLASVAVPAAAISVSVDDRPAEAAVGSQVSTTFTFTDLYEDYESWTLRGETNLTNVTWTVTTFDQAGNRIDQQSVDGSSFATPVDLEDDVASVEVRVTGTVPPIERYRYDPRQTTALGTFDLVRQGGTRQDIQTWRTQPYTEESKQARQAIDEAERAVDEAGGAGGQDLQQAISAYENGNFENAVSNADSAIQAAEGAQQQSQTTQVLLFGGIGVVALVAVVGGFVYWRNRQGPQDPLR